MSFSEQNVLSVVIIAFYSPAFFLSIFFCSRHGFSPNTGFLFLIVFSLIRLAGAAVELATIHYSASPQAAGVLQTVALVLSFTGVSPLLLSTLGLLYRVRFGMVKIYPTTIKPLHLVLLRLPVVAGLVLCDEGAIDVGSRFAATGRLAVPLTSRVGVVVFGVVSLATTSLTLVLLKMRARFDVGDRYVLYAVAASLPLIFARLIYGLLGAYAAPPEFGFFQGSVLLMGCMSVLPEMLVVVIYSILGVCLPRRSPEPVRERPKRERPKTKIVFNKPWSIVEVEENEADAKKRPEKEESDKDSDNASIMGQRGDDHYMTEKETFVVPGARGTVGRGRYLGSMLVTSYIPPLRGIDSGIDLGFDTK
ncbi:hypothetical protein BUE80_DR012180 [Diplocarpon rosae]|nr:hypothetical protein BUE80_DR012180 [Diplocarpon rosae]